MANAAWAPWSVDNLSHSVRLALPPGRRKLNYILGEVKKPRPHLGGTQTLLFLRLIEGAERLPAAAIGLNGLPI